MLDETMTNEELIKAFNDIIAEKDKTYGDAIDELAQRNVELVNENVSLRAAIRRLYADKSIPANEDGLDILYTEH